MLHDKHQKLCDLFLEGPQSHLFRLTYYLQQMDSDSCGTFIGFTHISVRQIRLGMLRFKACKAEAVVMSQATTTLQPGRDD
jgi:hypothetical protein